MIPLTVKELFQQEFDAIYLEDKIALAEQISFCILKKIENQTTHKLKLICSKQKCQFSIKLELSPIENKYYLRDIHAEHNHHISKEKFEEKMLTGRLLKYSEFIYKNYFLLESEFCSKPKLILKDLKTKHNLDILSGNYSAAQKQKLKKKFDNIVQQLRLKKNRQLGISDSAATTIALGSSAILPHIPSGSGCEGLNSSMQLPNIPMNQVKKVSSNSFVTRDAAHSLSTAILGDSTNKSSKKRITSGSSSNFDFQNAETINQACIYSPPQNNSSNPQMLSLQKGNLAHFAMINNNFANPHFQLTLLQQQHLLQQQQQQIQLQQQQQQQLQQQIAMKKMSPQVISEDSRSASFCKVEDLGEQSVMSSNNLESSLPRKIVKQNSPVNTFTNPINGCPIPQSILLQIPLQQQQQNFSGNPSISAQTQILGFPSNYDIGAIQQNAQTQQPQAAQTAEQQIMIKLQENQIQQEKIKQEELQLKLRLQQQQQQQQQQIQSQQQQIFNPFNSFLLQGAIPQQNILQNPQLMNLQLLIQNQQAGLSGISQSTNPALAKIPQNPLIQQGILPILSAGQGIPAFNSTTQVNGALLQALPDQSLLMNKPELSASHGLRNLQAAPFFANSGMIPTSSV
ncbi:hypothetical protein ABPG72_004288 [Tetrahymena utriculariae]